MKSLLVHLDGGAASARRLALADGLATRLGAQLTALFAVASPLLDHSPAFAAGAAPLGVLEDLYAGWRHQAQALLERSGAAGRTAWAEVLAQPLHAAVAEQAMYADLLLLGQHDPLQPEPRVDADFVPSVLLASGRPALVLPHSGRFDSVGRRALVAWTPAPSAARALAGALPLLAQAEQVDVVEWGAAPSPVNGEPLDVERYLRRHGIAASLQRYADTPRDLGELLLSHAADRGADLLVMGCYGHSRAREWALGGASRTVLQCMTLPVLMSH